MGVRRTTWRQRAIAGGQLHTAFLTAGAIALPAILILAGRLHLLVSQGLVGYGILLVTIVLATACGWLVTGLVSIVVFGPLAYDQGLKNGGPFQVGDRVQIITGPHRNRIGRIYRTAQHDAFRVELGDAEQRDNQDIFCAHQVLRIDGEPNPQAT